MSLASTVALGGGLLLLGRLIAGRSSARAGYTPAPEGRYGPVWKNRRPPGLPMGARPAGARDSAVPGIVWAAGPHGYAFTAAMVKLARHESGARYGLPARNFDARSAAERGELPLKTAYGAFNSTRAAWIAQAQRAGLSAPGDPWLATPEQELRVPIGSYAVLWSKAKTAGASDADAERLLHAWHMQSTGLGMPMLAHLQSGRTGYPAGNPALYEVVERRVIG